MGQTKAAALLGMSQGALNKALRVGREVYVVCHDNGSYEAHELKPFPSQAPKTTATEGALQQPTAQIA
ncbi:Cro [compost metagenome]